MPETPPPKPRTTVSIAIGHSARDGLELADGTRLESIVTVVSAVELHSCPKDGAGASRLLEVIVPSAHAHVPTSSTRLGDPAAADLLDGRDASRVIGEVSTPLERFCSAWVIFAPADDDVLNITPIADDELVGSSVVARDQDGRLHKTSMVRAVEVELADPNEPGPLQFDRAGSGPMLLFDVEIGDAGSRDVGQDAADAAAPVGETEAAESILSNLRVSLRQFDEPAKDSPAEPTETTP